MLSRGASSAAELAKDFTSQASTKAAELGGTMSNKVNFIFFNDLIYKN